LHADHLVARYERIRRPRVLDRDPDPLKTFSFFRVSRSAPTSPSPASFWMPRNSAFPERAIWFTGPKKSWELFAADTRLRHLADRVRTRWNH
jgi:hypothetical protein